MQLARLLVASAALLGLLATPPVAGATPVSDEALEEEDEVSMLQRPLVAPAAAAASRQPPAASEWPILIPLQRESVPIMRGSKVVSHKTSYAGAIQVGQPAQDFRVVFDTGSAHIVLPSSTCKSDSCLEHRRYNVSASAGSEPINVDGTTVVPDELCDQATIGYGTGEVTGEFARDKVCLGGGLGDTGHATCVDVTVVMAVEMSEQPFKSFKFDGIFGLSLDALAISPEFSFFNRVAGAATPGGRGRTPPALQFGVFLAGADSSEDLGSEIALGGYNGQRMLTPLQWAPVASQQMGYWQVQIKAVRIGNRTLDICKDGSCRGIVDTGTSHLGVPSNRLGEFSSALIADATEGQDCRTADAPDLEIVLEGFTLSLSPKNYMRPLPVQKGMVLGRGVGQNVGSERAGARDAVAAAAGAGAAHTCAAKIMPVNLGAAVGPNVFILGEPLLHRYYTVYDWQEKKIGFGLSAIPQNREALALVGQEQQHEDEDAEEIYSFMQVTLTVLVRPRPGRGAMDCGGSSSNRAALDAPTHLEL